MNDIRNAADEQHALWNGPAGNTWVDLQPLLDRLFEPLEARLAGAVPAGAAAHVLDVGCGTGATTLAIARRLGSQGRCTGIDISAPMIAAARVRAVEAQAAGGGGAPAEFIVADAQTHAFELATFDAVVSRFGVMFFGDFVQAFGNLRRATKKDGVLCVAAWRSPSENPFMTTAERAAAPLLPALPPRQPDAPGQFAFADAGRVRAILSESGWGDIDFQPFDFPCALPEAQLTQYISRLGPVGAFLQQADEVTRARVVETVRAAFETYVHGDQVRFTAACWMIRARAGG